MSTELYQIVDTCPLTECEGGLLFLREAKGNACNWLVTAVAHHE